MNNWWNLFNYNKFGFECFEFVHLIKVMKCSRIVFRHRSNLTHANQRFAEKQSLFSTSLCRESSKKKLTVLILNIFTLDFEVDKQPWYTHNFFRQWIFAHKVKKLLFIYAKAIKTKTIAILLLSLAFLPFTTHYFN